MWVSGEVLHFYSVFSTLELILFQPFLVSGAAAGGIFDIVCDLLLFVYID